MAGQQSFDITTGCDLQEVDNAVNQALKEITQRFDFKGIKAGIDLMKAENKIVLTGPDDFKIKAIWDVLQGKLVKRKVPLRNLKAGDIQPAGGGTARQEISLQQGIPIDTAREIVKYLKDQKLKKVQAAIQADQVRVSSPSRDDLQHAMGLLRQKDFGVELQFGNYRQ
ncbi:MAG TPA: YajQ family cyclic di-GMP-binding protein [Candidatus Polarisedimenticolaceae bacterium]|nr:YajQ family cyclic di-GMP-binding protein [Candidatus Polarisedimenticolaceae bacterium]